VVVEIGTGPGIFAVLACQLGASWVYASSRVKSFKWLARLQPLRLWRQNRV